MKRLLLSLLAIIILIPTATAQTKSPNITEANRDTLTPEIVIDLWVDYQHFSHPVYPETGFECVVWGTFCTTEHYSQYLWEVDEQFLPIGGNPTDESLYVEFRHPGYLKVTVWDEFGNSGSDSIWFNIKDWVTPMENFMMEVDTTNHAIFSGIATREHSSLAIRRAMDTLSWPITDVLNLHPGYWSWRDERCYFTTDSIWNYQLSLCDSCGSCYGLELIPGMMMGTQPAPGGGWYLTMKSYLQMKSADYVYPLFTIDNNGERHPFIQDGEQVILPASANSYLIPGRHPDAYYQGAVAKLDRRTREYEIVSFSNKVENPLPDLDGVVESGIPRLSVYPNPSHGTFTVQGTGTITVINMMGQIVATGEAKDGAVAFKLRSGVYFVRDDEGAVEKVVVE